MLRKFLSIGFFFFSCIAANAAEPMPLCPHDPSERLKDTVVGIELMFDPKEIVVNEKLQRIYGVQGTAWFLDQSTLVTIIHVATGMKLSGHWKEITLFWSDDKDMKRAHSFKVNARIKDIVIGIAALEPMVTLELQTPPPFGKKAILSGRPLRRNEAVVGIGYKGETLRFAQGRLAYPDPDPDQETSGDPPPPPYLPFEMADMTKNDGIGDRYVFDHGASGTPFFNCEGEVVSTVAIFLTREMNFGDKIMIITTPWGQANNLGVSSTPLLDKIK